MAPSARRVVQSRWWPGAVALGPALLVPGSLGAEGLAQGGLAPLAVAAVVAFFLGAPIAAAEWRAVGALAPREPEREVTTDGALGRGLFALSDVLSALLVAAVAAPLILRLGWTGQVVAVAGWLATIVGARRVGPGLAAVVAPLAAVVAIAGALTTARLPAWTLLEPHWDSWPIWLPGAVVLGVLLTPSGLGQWAAGPPLPPGGGRIGWATTGAAVWVALAVVWRHAARYESALGAPGPDQLHLIVSGLATLAAASAVVARRGTDRDVLTRAALGWLGTLWFTGPGAQATPFFLVVLLPVGLSIVLGVVARASVGPSRWTAAIAALACLLAAFFGPAALPDTVGGAGSVALTLVAVFWYVATRTVQP